jgi:hypothetical protein
MKESDAILHFREYYRKSRRSESGRKEDESGSEVSGMAKEKVAEAFDPSLEVANPTTSEVAKRDSEVGDSSWEVKTIAEGRIGRKCKKVKFQKRCIRKFILTWSFLISLRFRQLKLNFARFATMQIFCVNWNRILKFAQSLRKFPLKKT